MSCQRAFEIDLAAFLAEPRGSDFADFRDHYPRCAACSAEVRAWTEVEALLRAGVSDAHPEPRMLLRFADEALGDAEHASIAAHVDDCAPCRDELRALGDFVPDTLGAATPVAPRPDGTPWWEALRRLIMHPAFAYALVLVVAAPTLWRLVGPGGGAAPFSARDSLDRVVTPAPIAERDADEGLAAAAQESTAAPRERVAELREDRPRQVAPAASEKKEAAANVAREPAAPRARAKVASTPTPSKMAADRQAAPRAESVMADESVVLEEVEVRQSKSLGYVIAGSKLPFERRADGAVVVRVQILTGRGQSEVRLTSPDSRRTWVERPTPDAGEVVFEVPAASVEPGRWLVERRTGVLLDRFYVQVAPDD